MSIALQVSSGDDLATFPIPSPIHCSPSFPPFGLGQRSASSPSLSCTLSSDCRSWRCSHLCNHHSATVQAERRFHLVQQSSSFYTIRISPVRVRSFPSFGVQQRALGSHSIAYILGIPSLLAIASPFFRCASFRLCLKVSTIQPDPQRFPVATTQLYRIISSVNQRPLLHFPTQRFHFISPAVLAPLIASCQSLHQPFIHLFRASHKHPWYHTAVNFVFVPHFWLKPARNALAKGSKRAFSYPVLGYSTLPRFSH